MHKCFVLDAVQEISSERMQNRGALFLIPLSDELQEQLFEKDIHV